MDKKTVIIGAGPAGLAAAWRLLQEGMAVEVFEALADVGGLSATINDAGFIFDYGIHGFYPSSKESEYVVSLIKALCAEDIIEVHKKTSIYFRNRYLKYPLDLGGMLTALNPLTSSLCAIDFLFNRLKKTIGVVAPVSSFRDFIVSNFGTLLYNNFFGPYAQKVWGVSPSLLRADDIVRRVTTVSILDVIRKAIRRQLFKKYEKKGCYPQQPAVFYYGREGAGTVMKIIAQEIAKLGGVITTEAAVVAVNIRDHKVQEIAIRDKHGRGLQKKAAFFLSTMPITNLVKMISPAPPENIIQAAERLQFRALIFANLKLKKQRIFNDQWVYFSSKELIFNRINEFKNIKPEFSPTNKTGLTLEITCFPNDETWKLPAAKIYDKCVNDLKKLGLIQDGDIEGYKILRLPFIYPVPRVDTKEDLRNVLQYLSGIKNLFLAGREARFEYINMDESIHEGFMSAKKIKSLTV